MTNHSTAPPRAAVLGAAVTVLACAPLLALLPTSAAHSVSDVAQLGAAGAACVMTAGHAGSRTGGRARISWLLISLACASWAVAQGYWTVYALTHDSVPFPSVADVGFLGFAVFMAAGLVAHPSRSTAITRWQRLLDGLMTAGAVGLISWLTTVDAIIDAEDGDHSSGVLLLLLAYPCLDVLLVVLTVLLLARSGAGCPALQLVGLGVLALGVSDSVFVYQGAQGDYDAVLMELGWIGGFVLIALAGLCREPARYARALRLPDGSARAGTPHGATLPSAVLPYVPVLGALTTVVGVTLFGRPLTRPEMLAACFVVLCLLARQYLALRDNVHLAMDLAARERELRHQALHDPLTGLANRSLFRDRLEHVLELHARDGRPAAVIFLDLDGFKTVNDRHGHAAGDELLIRVAERIQGATRGGDTVARLGGDEFAILLEDGGDPERSAARILDALRHSFVVSGHTLNISASAGVSGLRAGDVTVAADQLLARSDTAMYAAKRAGKAVVVTFDEAMRGGPALDQNMLALPS